MSLSLEAVTRRVGRETHIDRVDLTFEPGSFNVLLGRTLSGKTSLMRLMAGLDVPSDGRIVMNGEDVTGRKPSALVQAGVVQCPEGRKLFPEMSVLKKNSGSQCALRGYGREICIGKLMNLKLMNPMIQEDSIR